MLLYTTADFWQTDDQTDKRIKACTNRRGLESNEFIEKILTESLVKELKLNLDPHLEHFLVELSYSCRGYGSEILFVFFGYVCCRKHVGRVVRAAVLT